MTSPLETLKVSSKSRPKSVAGALSTVVERDRQVALQAIGAGAVNQAVKAIAIARSYLEPKGLELISVIAFTTMIIDGNERSAIRFEVEIREIVHATAPRTSEDVRIAQQGDS